MTPLSTPLTWHALLPSSECLAARDAPRLASDWPSLRSPLRSSSLPLRRLGELLVQSARHVLELVALARHVGQLDLPRLEGKK